MSSNLDEINHYLGEAYEEIKGAFSCFRSKSDLEMFYYFHNVSYKIISIDHMIENNLIDEKGKVLSLLKKITIVKNRKHLVI